jgi:hypothetical protein
MARRDLIDLLQERPIFHPSWIDGISWRGRTLTIAIRGSRWWEGPYDAAQAEGAASIVFDEVGEGRLYTDGLDPDFDEALEGFEILPVSEVAWAQAPGWSIYCSGPIGNPLRLYSRVHDYLSSDDAFLPAEHFLNQADDLSKFVAMAQSAGFLIGHGPSRIRDLICEELVHQSTPHNVIERKCGAWPKFLVRLCNSAFLCGNAALELAD